MMLGRQRYQWRAGNLAYLGPAYQDMSTAAVVACAGFLLLTFGSLLQLCCITNMQTSVALQV